MYRVEKVLNHNAVIAIHDENHGEYLLMGKGIGEKFGNPEQMLVKTAAGFLGRQMEQ